MVCPQWWAVTLLDTRNEFIHIGLLKKKADHYDLIMQIPSLLIYLP